MLARVCVYLYLCVYVYLGICVLVCISVRWHFQFNQSVPLTFTYFRRPLVGTSRGFSAGLGHPTPPLPKLRVRYLTHMLTVVIPGVVGRFYQ